MGLLKNILKSSNNVLQHKPGNVPKFVPLKCTVVLWSTKFSKDSHLRTNLNLNLVSQAWSAPSAAQLQVQAGGATVQLLQL